MRQTRQVETIAQRALADEMLVQVAKKFSTQARQTILYEDREKHAEEIALILSAIDGLKKFRIVDVGGGVGVNLVALSHMIKDREGDLVLIDRFEEYTAGNPMGSFSDWVGLLSGSGIKLISQDFITEPHINLEDESADVATILDVVEHLPQSPLRILSEIFRILKPGGNIILSGPNLFGIAEISKWLRGHHPYIDFNTWMDDKYYSHFREYTKREYEEILKRAGFCSTESYRTYGPTRTRVYNSYWKTKLEWYNVRRLVLLAIFVTLRVLPPFRPEVLCKATKPLS